MRATGSTAGIWRFVEFGALLATVGLGPVAPATPATEAALVSLIEAKTQEAHLPGLAAVLVKHGQIAWQRNFGVSDLALRRPVTGDTVFRLASVSKTFTAVALMQLAEQGLFHLDDAVDRALPFSVRHPKFPLIPITYRMLLTHTAGIADNFVALDPYWNWQGDTQLPLADLIRAYFSPAGTLYATQNFLDDAPGTRTEYANMGIALAGYLVERWSARPFADDVAARIMRPLGIESAAWYGQGFAPDGGLATPYEWDNGEFVPLRQYGYPDVPAGMLRISANDLARFLNMLIAGGQAPGAQILKSETMAEMRRVQLPNVASDQGLVFYYTDAPDGSGRQLLGHNGGDPGITSEMFWVSGDPDGLGYILLSNTDATLDDGVTGQQRAAAFDAIVGPLLRFGAALP